MPTAIRANESVAHVGCELGTAEWLSRDTFTGYPVPIVHLVSLLNTRIPFANDQTHEVFFYRLIMRIEYLF